ncbi:triacylglycerol lipase [Nocardia sp. 348MFTsu5.1]|uniref:esterase/lipase family protein n=1 Tax=Nocardia sp. 348MFTsu5.1 TaxID=1172185 RepID=UPI000382DF30|nr:alpha/beta fold hydrolase [Nocardia sp. 348MFTsu5.1]
MRAFRTKFIAAAVAMSTALAVGICSPAAAGPEPDVAPTSSKSQVPDLTAPAQGSHPDASRYVRQNPGAVPPGVNDFSCLPSPTRPRPVVLLHGTDSTAYSDFAALGPRLSAAGYCVFALNYGGRDGEANYGTEDIRNSAAQVAEFVKQVRTATHSEHVDVVGYSQGATVGRYFINKLGGAQVVGHWVGLASPSYGSSMYGLVAVADQVPGAMDEAVTILPKELVSTALWQQAQGSAFLDDLNNPSDTVPGVKYVTIASLVDEVIQPPSNVALRDPAATNVVLQQICPGDLTGHFRMPYDDVAIRLVMAALDPQSGSIGECVDVPLGAGVLDMVIAENS